MTTNEKDIDIIQDSPVGTVGEQQTKSKDIKAARIAVMATADDEYNVTEPSTADHAQYLYSRVEQTLSGHIKETDDTPGAERMFEMHKSGTFTEVHPDGSKVTKIFGRDFYIVLDDHDLYVGGNLNITVHGNANMLVKGDVKQKVGGNLENTVLGDMTTRVKGKYLLYVEDDIDIQTEQNINVLCAKTANFRAEANMIVQAKSTASLTGSRAVVWGTTTASINGTASRANQAPNGSGGSIGSKPSAPKIKRNKKQTLNIPDSLIQPSKEALMALKTDNNTVIGSVDDSDMTFPKDRTNI